jgi:DNA-binding response OmpR family regulator
MRMNILVVEHDPQLAHALCHLLLSFGVKGIPARHRDEALEILENNHDIGLALIDIDNEEVQGRLLLDDIKKSHQHRGIKIIIHTAEQEENLIDDIFELDIIGYISKPFEEKAVFSSLRAISTRMKNLNMEKRSHIRINTDSDDPLRVLL